MSRNLANLVLNAAKGESKGPESRASASATELNLVGEREFLTKETAQEALALLLAADSAVTKVHPLLSQVAPFWRTNFSCQPDMSAHFLHSR